VEGDVWDALFNVAEVAAPVAAAKNVNNGLVEDIDDDGDTSLDECCN
jgi:hypothetical protein